MILMLYLETKGRVTLVGESWTATLLGILFLALAEFARTRL